MSSLLQGLATAEGSIFYTTPEADAYAEFDGSVNCRISTPDFPTENLPTTGRIVIEGDCMINTVPQTSQRSLINHGRQNDEKASINLFYGGQFGDYNRFRFQISGDGLFYTTLISAGTVLIDERFTIKAIYDDSTTAMELYINDILVAENPNTGITSLFASDSNVGIGCYGTNSGSWKGRIYGVTVKRNGLLLINFDPSPYKAGDPTWDNEPVTWALKGTSSAVGIPDPALYNNGLPFDSDGALVMDSYIRAVAFHHQGMPFTANNRIAANFVSAVPSFYNAGAMPIDANGRLQTVTGAAINHYQCGVPYDSNGAVVMAAAAIATEAFLVSNGDTFVDANGNNFYVRQ